jgi:hypothetical protein
MLNNLLNSVQLSVVKPSYIIIVSSGDDITKIIEIHEKNLEIVHHHTNKIGQSNQKVIAISMLKPVTKWVFLLDDDLELLPNTLGNAFRRIKLIQSENTNGIGTNIMDKTINFQNLKPGIFQSKRKIGKISPSGRALKYAFKDITYTEWLNGASIWRADCLNQYMLPVLDSTYAAYEDVIFSSNIALTSKLVYDPSIILYEQTPHSRVTLNFKQFKYITLWTGYLVCSRLDTSIINFKMLTLTRMFFFLFSKRRIKNIEFSNILYFSKFVFGVLNLPNDKVKSRILLVAFLKNESTYI